MRITRGGSVTDGIVWQIKGAELGAGCQADGGRNDGRLRNGGSGPTRSFDIRLAGGDDRLEFEVQDSVADDAPSATIDLGADDDVLDSSATNTHSVLGGDGHDVLTLSGHAPPSSGGPPVAGPDPLAVTLDGGTGDDVLNVAGRRSADVLIGGADADTVTADERPRAPVRAGARRSRVSEFSQWTGGALPS